jgi:hypothetical protein
MFGRLNDQKRSTAVRWMRELTETTADILIYWSTGTGAFIFTTPKKPYIDELYVLISVTTAFPYLGWRKGRADAYEDLKTYYDQTFSDVYKKYKADWPFRITVDGEKLFLDSVYELVDKRVKQYEAAWHDEIVNLSAEFQKWSHSHSGAGNPEADWVIGTLMAERPFAKLAVRILFDVDGEDKDVMDKYIGFGLQIMPLLSDRGETLMKNLKRL